eukprot:gene9971-biopygen1622
MECRDSTSKVSGPVSIPHGQSEYRIPWTDEIARTSAGVALDEPRVHCDLGGWSSACSLRVGVHFTFAHPDPDTLIPTLHPGSTFFEQAGDARWIKASTVGKHILLWLRRGLSSTHWCQRGITIPTGIRTGSNTGSNTAGGGVQTFGAPGVRWSTWEFVEFVEYAGIHRSAPQYAGVRWSILGYVRVSRSTSEHRGVPRSISKYPGVPSILSYPGVPWSILKYTGIPWSMMQFSGVRGVRRSTLEYAGVPRSTLEHVGVCWSTLEFMEFVEYAGIRWSTLEY